jgi:hypothetical protein
LHDEEVIDYIYLGLLKTHKAHMGRGQKLTTLLFAGSFKTLTFQHNNSMAISTKTHDTLAPRSNYCIATATLQLSRFSKFGGTTFPKMDAMARMC